MSLSDLYRLPLGLVNDLYQLTMAYGYWKGDLADREAVFHLGLRSCPFDGGFTVAAGLETALDYVASFRISAEDADYLAALEGNDGKALLERGFLDWLCELRLDCAIDAVPEGSLVFAGEPILRVRGPLLQAQLLETPLLNIVGFQSLVATKAARVCWAAGGPVLEFGLRRAQGFDGGLSASRAAFIGGCAATSNTLAGRLYDIPVRGTHAHSWVLAHADEAQAFQAYSEVMPNNATLLVDTYDTRGGIERAIEAGRWLREQDRDLEGIRLDSGDLVELSRWARRALDRAGFERTSIVASGDLDEHRIMSLKAQGAQIDVWGVGTRLATGHPDAALAIAYKLGALRATDGSWQYRAKLSSDESAKESVPGMLQICRFEVDGTLLGDGIFNQLAGDHSSVDDFDWPPPRLPSSDYDSSHHLLLETVLENGRRSAAPALADIRQRAKESLEALPAGLRQLSPRSSYPVGLETGLSLLKQRLGRR